MPLLQSVRQFVRQHALFGADTRVMVALSGGSDSVALAHLLRELHAHDELRFVAAAHFNHQLRDSAVRDQDFSATIARSLDVPFITASGDVAARATQERRSIEDAARRARYEFFERARGECNADVVALGHTRDDQAETFLLRLIRGAGPRGLAGMHPRRGAFVRPVLDCRRAELRAYLDARQVGYVDDETNADVSIPRNRVRAELLPLLEDRFNPSIVDVLADAAELERELWLWLESAASGLEQDAETPRNPLSRDLDVALLNAAPPPLRRLLLWRAMNAVAPGRSVSFRHVQAVLGLLNAQEGAAVDAPGQRVQRLGTRIVLSSRDSARLPGRRPAAKTPANLFEYLLSIPGEVQLSEVGCIVAAELGGDAGQAPAGARTGKGPLAIVRGDLCQGPLTIRSRRPGDGFRPVGVGGRKKLQDYFVDRKVASSHRDRVPLVVDDAGRIVWVAGYGIDEAFQVTDPSQSVLLLRLKQA